MDLQLIDIMRAGRGGFFLEAGANDGILQSNTYYLEKVLGWKGILIEALPDKAALCMRNRRRSTVVQGALVSSSFDRDTVSIERANLMSVVNDEHMDPGWVATHVAKGRHIQGLDATPSIVVPAMTLTEVLRRQGIQRIDFASLDVEGYELEVLRGMDFSLCAVHWLLVETRAENEDSIDALLKQNGFAWRRSWVSPEYSNKLYELEEWDD
jgi:FkbM family methyltransferase